MVIYIIVKPHYDVISPSVTEFIQILKQNIIMQPPSPNFYVNTKLREAEIMYLAILNLNKCYVFVCSLGSLLSRVQEQFTDYDFFNITFKLFFTYQLLIKSFLDRYSRI